MRRRRLNNDDVASFILATEKRPREPARSRQEAMTDILHKQNPVRWWRLKHDAKWARRVLLRKGFDPEEIRWLL